MRPVGGFMRKFTAVRIVAVVALAGSAVTAAVLATGGVSAASKAPVAATCSSIAGTTTIAIEVSGTASSVYSGCSGGKSAPTAVDTSTLSNPSPTNGAGSGTIYWTNKKTTTYTFTVTAPATAFTCPQFWGQASSGEEVLTVTPTGGNAKITAVGTTDICYYIAPKGDTGGSTDVYETNVGTATF